MMYPQGRVNQDKLQKIFIASTPFNMLFMKYFKSKGDDSLEKYIDSLVEEYVKEHNITTGKLIQQIEDKYEEYLISTSDFIDQ